MEKRAKKGNDKMSGSDMSEYERDSYCFLGVFGIAQIGYDQARDNA